MTDGHEQSSAASPVPPRSNWTAGRVVGLVFSSIGGLIGLALLVVGVALVLIYALGRDNGYFNSDRKDLKSATFAITTGEIDLGADELDWAPSAVLGNVRVQADSEQPVFVGIGSDEDVSRYLAGVAHDELIDFNEDQPTFALHAGKAPRAPPRRRSFWVAKSEGSGEQTVTWNAESGRWTAVVMNADGARGINVEAEAGIKLDWVIWVGLGILGIGLLITVGAVVLILHIGRRASRAALT